MKCLSLCAALLMIVGLTFGQAEIQRKPIIDVHMHSESLANLKDWGPNPVTGKRAPESVEEHIKQTLEAMDRYNIVLGIASGGPAKLRGSGVRLIATAPTEETTGLCG
jgi:hypothetical protein